jgi:hypothetical protein
VVEAAREAVAGRAKVTGAGIACRRAARRAERGRMDEQVVTANSDAKARGGKSVGEGVKRLVAVEAVAVVVAVVAVAVVAHSSRVVGRCMRVAAAADRDAKPITTLPGATMLARTLVRAQLCAAQPPSASLLSKK